MSDPSDPNALAMVLVAELHKIGLFDEGNLATIARRLELSGEDDLAERVRALPVSNALTDPVEMRAGLHVIHGGNEDAD
ncbi:hypothetical protein INR77_08870 [Erythrobacter sp. SCSIO 43205]|uniref:hypothetical protein n=1 Tax=Erythrobacter sp. SCSIO 43205 TaxID=2779361 RepID=UPI001CA9DDF0|nr:hypothetical protein [Erythrobacter sp. SCSIO 43205]UAB76959.1 hypothetical protein INR77_08870 [Erythrobacter sp. SCSIO 43205]